MGLIALIFFCHALYKPATAAQESPKSYKFQNFEVATEPDLKDQNTFLVRVLMDGRQVYAGESSLNPPKVRELNATPSPDCRTVLVELFSGGAHCCFTDLVLTTCPKGRTAAEIDLSNGPGVKFRDTTRSGTMQIVLNDWSFSYYSFNDRVRLSFASSPAMKRLLVFEANGWRPDTPGQFPAFYKNRVTEAYRDFRKSPKSDTESKASRVIAGAYYEFMRTGNEKEALSILRKNFPRPWQPFSDRVLSDIKKAALDFNPIKPIR